MFSMKNGETVGRKLGAIALFVSNILSKKRMRINWRGDGDGASPVNQTLRAINVHAEDFLKRFFKHELAGTLGYGKTPLLLSLDISLAEAIRIAERIKRYQEQKRANFISGIRRYGKYKRESER